MPQSQLDAVLRDLRKNRDVTGQVKHVLSLSLKDLPRPKRLDFVKAVIAEVTGKPLDSAHHTFVVAIAAFRDLTQFLQRKEQSHAFIVAAVEKYVVNHASSLCFEEQIQDVELLSSLSELLDCTLARVFAARVPAPKRARRGRSRISDSQDAMAKENQDPQVMGDKVNSSFPIKGSGCKLLRSVEKRIRNSVMPEKDSATVAAVVTSALVIKWVMEVGKQPLLDLVEEAKILVLPWIRYMQSMAKDSETQYARICNTHLKRIQVALLSECQLAKGDPPNVLKTRAFALTLTGLRIDQYSRDLLRSVNRFARGGHYEESENLSDIIQPIYEDALKYVSRYPMTDCKWYSEDVSAWLDNVALVWCTSSVSRPLPALFGKRLSALRKQSDEVGIYESCELQQQLLKRNLYAPRALVVKDHEESICDDHSFRIIQNLLEKFSLPTLSTLLQVHGKQNLQNRTGRECELNCLRRLRFLRVLEPIRKVLVSAGSQADRLPHGAVLVLELYVTSLLDGFIALETEDNNCNTLDDDTIDQVRCRLDKMIGACVEAVREVSRHRLQEKEWSHLSEIAQCVDILLRKHSERSTEAAQKWRSWISSFYCKALRESVKNNFSQTPGHVSDRNTLIHIAQIAESMAKLWLSRGNSNLCSYNFQTEFLELARGCYTVTEEWSHAARTSWDIFSLASVALRETKPLDPKKGVHYYARRFSEDTILALQSCTLKDLFQFTDCKHDLMLAAVMRYCTDQKQSTPVSARQKPGDKVRSLLDIRDQIFQCSSEKQSTMSCSQRKLHALWMSFLRNNNSGSSFLDVDALMESKTNSGRCPGHSPVDLFSSHHRAICCSAEHDKIVANLSSAIHAFRNRSINVVESELLSIRAKISSVADLSQDLELQHICLEIVEWFSAVLATEDFDQVAGLAHGVAEICMRNLEISNRSPSVLNAYRNLFGLNEWPCYLLPDNPNICDPNFKKLPTRRNKAWHLDSEDQRMEVSQAGTATDECGLPILLDVAQRRLKSSIVPLMQLPVRTKLSSSEHSFQLGGTFIDISFDIRTAEGQATFCSILKLVANLYYFGSVLHTIECFANASYYIQQCALIVTKCFPSECYFRMMMTTLCCVRHPPSKDLDQSREEQLLEQLSELTLGSSPQRSSVSRFATLQSLCIISLEAFSCRFTTEIGKVIGNKLKAAVSVCEGLENAVLSDDRNYVYPNFDPRITRPAIELFTEPTRTEPLQILKTVLDGSETKDITKLACVYIMVYFFTRTSEGIGSAVTGQGLHRSLAHQKSGRMTRSRTRKLSKEPHSNSETNELISRILETRHLELSSSYFCPQFSRQIWKFQGIFASKEKQRLEALTRSTGCTFNLRWIAAMHERRARQSTISDQMDVDRLETALDRLRVSSSSDYIQMDDMPVGQGCFEGSTCVVVGLHVDESMKYLTLWQRSSHWTVSKQISLPTKSGLSVEGVKHRVRVVLDSMKEKSVKPGQVFTEQEKQEWWEHRFRLDSDMKQIVSDIETEWLGPLRVLLIPLLQQASPPGKDSDFDGYDPCDVLVQKLNVTCSEFIHSKSDGLKTSENSKMLGELVLIVDSVLEAIPWESLPILRQLNIGVTRAPSLEFLNHEMTERKGFVDPRSLFFVVNPDGDLGRTESTVKELQASEWSGSFGKISKETVINAYKREEVYLYCGHGAGDQYLPAKKISKQGKCPIALLMGCSSARPQNEGMANSESNGPAVDYLVHGSKAVVGNLWDVGTKDIDRFTVSMLSLWLQSDHSEDEPWQSQSLAKSVALSRSACHLPYLVGAASVVIGRPQIWAQTHGQAD